MTTEPTEEPGTGTAPTLRKHLEAYIRDLEAGDVGEVRKALAERTWQDEHDRLDVADDVMSPIDEHLDAAEAALEGPAADVPGALNHIRSAIAHLPDAWPNTS